jgi:effector-binding domain-containing protein
VAAGRQSEAFEGWPVELEEYVTRCQALVTRNSAQPGPRGGIFTDDLFGKGRGQATIFVPCDGTVRPLGRVVALVIPPAELAITVYAGSHSDVDRAYGSLATYVTQHALVVDGRIRENYLVARRDTTDESQWRTEIDWPIFQTGDGA